MPLSNAEKQKRWRARRNELAAMAIVQQQGCCRCGNDVGILIPLTDSLQLCEMCIEGIASKLGKIKRAKIRRAKKRDGA